MTTVIPFSRYNEEFSSLVNQTRQTLQSITSILNQTKNIDIESPSSSSSSSSSLTFKTEQERQNALNSKSNLANQLLNQTKDLLKQMTIESRSINSNSSNNYTKQEIEECKKILSIAKANHANLKDDVTSIQNEVQHYLLLSSSSSSSSHDHHSKKNRSSNTKSNSDIKQHLLSTNQSLHNQNSNLDRSKQIMADTELIAMEITDELARNRETIESAHSRVRGVNSLSNHARRILVNMGRREVQQKMAVYGVGVVLVLVLLFLLGFF